MSVQLEQRLMQAMQVLDAGGGNGDEKGGSDFLGTEYATAIDLVKYYDERHGDLLKFACGLSAGVPTIIFGFYGLSDQAAEAVWKFTVFIAAITAIGLACILAAMVRNRLYFVFPARQANVLRNRLFDDAIEPLPADKKPTNQMYTTGAVPMLDWKSTQGIQLILVALQCALFVAATDYAYGRSGIAFTEIQGATILGGVVFVILLWGIGDYVKSRRALTANQIITTRFALTARRSLWPIQKTFRTEGN